MTSSTVSSECVDEREWGDPFGMDHHPAIVSSERVERQERGDPYFCEASEELLNKPTKIPKPNKNGDHEREQEDPYYSDIPEWLRRARITSMELAPLHSVKNGIFQNACSTSSCKTGR